MQVRYTMLVNSLQRAFKCRKTKDFRTSALRYIRKGNSDHVPEKERVDPESKLKKAVR